MGWGSGCGFDGDLVAEVLELSDEPAGVSFGVGSAFEPVGAELLVVDLVVQDVPDDHDQGVGDREDRLRLALLAEPATIFIAASISFALRSGSLISAIFRTKSFEILPTFSL